MSYQMGKAKNAISEKLHSAKDAVGLGHGGAFSNVDSTHKVHQHTKDNTHRGILGGVSGGVKEVSKVKHKERVSTHNHGYF